MTTDLPTQFKAARKAQRMTLKELGQKAGVHWVTLSRFETGYLDMGVRKLSRVAQALGMELALRPATQGYTLDDLANGLLREADVPKNSESPVIQRARRVRR